jgi:MoaA/NifB/PqqE/SkfB family radical SAM enzyme
MFIYERKVVPNKIRIETSTFCQLKCPSCPNASGNDSFKKVVGHGSLKFSAFKKILDDNPWVIEIELANYGEIFLNHDLLEIIRYAYNKKVRLTAGGGANLNYIDERVIEGLVKYKFHYINCAIDGATNETYNKYRIKGDFNKIMENIKRINHYKVKYNSQYPLLTWQFVILGHNEHELPIAREKANDLNMVFRTKFTWDDDFSPIRDKDFVKKEIGLDITSRKEFKEQYGVDYGRPLCYQLWIQPQINWDGKMLGCCRNFWGDFGSNAFEDGLIPSLNNERINIARRMLLGKEGGREDIPCHSCALYLDMQAENSWLTMGEIYGRRTLREKMGEIVLKSPILRPFAKELRR